MDLDSGLRIGFALLLCILGFVGLLAFGGLVLALVKLGVIASYWGKPAPADSGDQTLAQSREAGKVESQTPQSRETDGGRPT